MLVPAEERFIRGTCDDEWREICSMNQCAPARLSTVLESRHLLLYRSPPGGFFSPFPIPEEFFHLTHRGT